MGDVSIGISPARGIVTSGQEYGGIPDGVRPWVWTDWVRM